MIIFFNYRFLLCSDIQNLNVTVNLFLHIEIFQIRAWIENKHIHFLLVLLIIIHIKDSGVI